MSQTQFGKIVYSALCDRPLGSLTKRELELMLISASINAGLVKASPAEIAQTFQLGLAKSHGYLTDLALRLPTLNDVEGVNLLQVALKQAEVTPDNKHLTMPLNDAKLRIWLERKLSIQQLHQGESLRRELVKITPAALCKVLDSAQGLGKPYLALKALAQQFGKETWYITAKNHWKPETPWSDALKNVLIGRVCTVMSATVSHVIELTFT